MRASPDSRKRLLLLSTTFTYTPEPGQITPIPGPSAGGQIRLAGIRGGTSVGVAAHGGRVPRRRKTPFKSLTLRYATDNLLQIAYAPSMSSPVAGPVQKSGV
jgi:hypothetical protein